jgi:uncharacterized protein with ParB-like and HNH nuclease domain
MRAFHLFFYIIAHFTNNYSSETGRKTDLLTDLSTNQPIDRFDVPTNQPNKLD